jgi:hypothetical protein
MQKKKTYKKKEKKPRTRDASRLEPCRSPCHPVVVLPRCPVVVLRRRSRWWRGALETKRKHTRGSRRICVSSPLFLVIVLVVGTHFVVAVFRFGGFAVMVVDEDKEEKETTRREIINNVTCCRSSNELRQKINNLPRHFRRLLPPSNTKNGTPGKRRGTNDETKFRRLCPRLETRLRRVSSPR